MDIMLKLNPQYFEFFTPLVKWKILSVNDLYELSGYHGRKNSFHKLINRFETHQVIKSVNDLWSRKKYLYLTKLGEDLINHEEHIIGLSEEMLLHDMRLSELILAIKGALPTKEIKFEHEWRQKGQFSTLKRQYTDALLNREIKGKTQKIAIELELNQKSKERLSEKFQHYITSSYYDLCLYVFGRQNTMENYHRFCMEKFTPKEARKLVFFTLEGIEKGKFDLTNMQGLRANERVGFRSLFEADAKETWMQKVGVAIKGGRSERQSSDQNPYGFAAHGPDSPPTTKF